MLATVRCLFILAALAFTFPAALAAPVAGDVDHSGGVDAIDVQLVINAVLGLTVPPGTHADIDYNGELNAVDVQLVINAALDLTLDKDEDGLTDSSEEDYVGTDPSLFDTDGDVVGDGQEMLDGTDPLVPNPGSLPPAPETVAPEPDKTIATTVADASAFLYTGANPIQRGVSPGTMVGERVAVLSGNVMNKEEEPLAGVRVGVLDHTELGYTLTRDDGMFDLALNGGGALTITYSRAGYLPAQRTIDIPWQDFVPAPDVILVQHDSASTVIDFSEAIEVARGTTQTDLDGTRRATLLLPQGAKASMRLPLGGRKALEQLTVRLTEYTVGTEGPQMMPAELPPQTGYTYAMELSADEATKSGAKEVTFAEPLYYYVENFIGIPVGTDIPVGYYDREQAAWIPCPDGRVIKIVSTTGGIATVDADGDDVADGASALGELGFTDAERRKLATLYSVGQTLWRAPIQHFTPYDLNLPLVLPPGARYPHMQPPLPGNGQRASQTGTGSGLGTVDYANQIFKETVSIAGTPYWLSYSSDRVAGFEGGRSIDIPLTDSGIPSPLKRVELEMSVAGQTYAQTFSRAADLSYSFLWDGHDLYGREYQGTPRVTTRVGYVYDAYYAIPPSMAASFGYPSGTPIPGLLPARQERTLWQEQDMGFYPESSAVGIWSARGLELGGWTLSAHHCYDPATKVLYYGDGRRSDDQDDVRRTVTTAAGTGEEATKAGDNGDGGPAVDAKLATPLSTSVGPDGSVFIVDGGTGSIRKIDSDGIITTAAGGGEGTSYVEGGQATDVYIGSPRAVTAGPDGSFCFAATYLGNGVLVCRVLPSGVIGTFAGGGSPDDGLGDGLSAKEAYFDFVSGIALAPDGTMYLSDRARIRRIGPDGIVSTFAGDGTALSPPTAAGGDDGPALNARLINPRELSIGPDGSLYIADTLRVRMITPEGIISTVAGTGVWPDGGNDGNGGPAVDAPVSAQGLAVLPDGTLLIAEGNYNRVRRVSTDGIISAFAGHSGPDAFGGDGGPATLASFDELHSVCVAPGGDVFTTDWGNHRLRGVTSTMPGLADDNILLPDKSGRILFEFDKTGRHLRTIHALTGGMLQMFTYDSQGRLATITDGSSNVTTIERDGDGTPTAIVSPYGQRTELTLDTDGYLSEVENPANETTTFGYKEGGLLDTITSDKGAVYTVTYDEKGLVTKADLPGAGGTSTLTRTPTANGAQVTVESPTGRTDTYLNEHSMDGSEYAQNVPPDGATTESQSRGDGSFTANLPDGTATTVQEGPDPRFGMQAPVPNERTIQTPDGRSATLAMTRQVTLADADDLMSVETMTETSTVNGLASTSEYGAATHTVTTTSPAGRQQVTEIDDIGRTVTKSIPGLAAVAYTYDSNGRLSTVTQGSGAGARVTTFAYDAYGNVEAITDPVGRMVSFDHDAVGRLTGQTLTDGRYVQITTDSHGNPTMVTPPGRPVHGFDFNEVDQSVQYTPPSVGVGTGSTLFSYNGEQELEQVSYSDGTVVVLNHDAAGRVSSVVSSSGAVTYAYEPTTSKLSSITGWDGGVLSFTYDSALLLTETWTGAIAGQVSRTYDADLMVDSIAVAGASAVNYAYDDDGLMTQAGEETLSYNADNGMITGTALGAVSTTFLHNEFGELIGVTVQRGGTVLYSSLMTYDKIGRIVARTETTVDGVTADYDYLFNAAGYLYRVDKNSSTQSTYDYDDNGNRLSYQPGSGSVVSATYDDQDRLLTYGTATYTYTGAGALASKTQGGQTTNYTFDGLGRLSRVTLPAGTQVDYLYDGADRRIGKRVDSALAKGFLYQSDLLPAAELDSSGNIVSVFVYGSNSHVPDYMVRGGQTYRIVVDHLGSPRVVVNVSTGAVAQRMDYDEFGKVLTDTSPGFQPFGFAGGLYDADTGLVHFGERDYDPSVGRWISKDPLGFLGADTNLYCYAINDPINIIDPQGTGPALGLLAIPGLIPYIKTLMTTPWVAGSDKGLAMVRAGIEFGDEAYRAQLRIFGNLLHVAMNKQYPSWRGLHLAWNDMHIYLNRIVFQNFKSELEMAIDWKTKMPYFRAPYKVLNYFEAIKGSLGKTLPYIRTAGKVLGGALRILGPISSALTYEDVTDQHEAVSAYLRQQYGNGGAAQP